MDAHVLVPLKRLDRAKSRLAAALSPGERATLMKVLLDGVVEAVRSAGVHRITVVTSERLVDDRVETWCDRGLPWNAALEAAMREVVSAEIATVIAADLPFVEPDDVDALVAATPEVGVAIARARDGGTNAVSLRPPGALRTCFGAAASSARHAEAAAASHLDHVVLDRRGLAFDVDTPEDLASMRRAWNGARRAELRTVGTEVGH